VDGHWFDLSEESHPEKAVGVDCVDEGPVRCADTNEGVEFLVLSSVKYIIIEISPLHSKPRSLGWPGLSVIA
jgi:hypothetical protein